MLSQFLGKESRIAFFFLLAMLLMASVSAQENFQLYQEKYQKGIDFHARGNEPSWNLEIDFESIMRFSTLNGMNLATPPVQGRILPGGEVTVYEAKTEAGELRIEVKRTPCTDNMSGEKFLYAVRVLAKNTIDKSFTTFEGCGRDINNHVLHDIWIVQEFSETQKGKAAKPSELTVFEFNLTEMKFIGQVGCRNMEGLIQVRGNRIQFGDVRLAQDKCKDNAPSAGILSRISGKAFSYLFENGRLFLRDEAGTLITLRKTD